LEISYKDGKQEQIKAESIQTNDNQTKSGIIDLFIKTIQEGKPAEISGEEGLEALRIVFACLESSSAGKKIVLNRHKKY
jgi:predicted dehydrogenase